MKGIFSVGILAFVLALASAAQTTPNLGLNVPTPGTQFNTWGALENYNFSLLDGYLGGSSPLPLNLSIAGTLSAGNFTGHVGVVSPGVFTNTQNNLNSTFDVNGLSFLDIFQNHVQGGNPSAFTSDAVSAGILVPAGANVLQANAVGGYAESNSTASFVVAGYFPCLANVAGAFCWGINPWAGDTPGLPNATQLRSIEADLNLNNVNDTGYGIVVQGTWSQLPGLAQGYLCQRPSGPGVGFGWTNCFSTSPSASLVAFLAAPSLLAGPANSQFLTFEAYDNSTHLVNSNLFVDPTGALIFAPGIVDAPFAADTIKPKGGSPPTCTFTSGGGTSPSCIIGTGSSNSAGVILATTGTGSPAGTGTMTLTFHGGNSIGSNAADCVYMASDASAGQWQALAVMKGKTPSSTNDLFTWTNGTGPTNLTGNTAYRINYHCWGQ